MAAWRPSLKKQEPEPRWPGTIDELREVWRQAEEGDPHAEARQLVVDHLVDDAIVAHAQSPEPGELAFEDASGRGLLGQAIDSGDQAQTIGFVDPA